MASKNTTLVRVRRETLALLKRLLRKWEDASADGRFPAWGQIEEPTLAHVIDELVRRELAHQDRCRRSAASRKARGADAGNPMMPSMEPDTDGQYAQ